MAYLKKEFKDRILDRVNKDSALLLEMIREECGEPKERGAEWRFVCPSCGNALYRRGARGSHGCDAPEGPAGRYTFLLTCRNILKLIYYFISLQYQTTQKMKRYKVKQVLDLLKADGWEIRRMKGDHRQLKNTKGKGGTVTVNGSLNDVLDQFLLNSIWKQAGWK